LPVALPPTDPSESFFNNKSPSHFVIHQTTSSLDVGVRLKVEGSFIVRTAFSFLVALPL